MDHSQRGDLASHGHYSKDEPVSIQDKSIDLHAAPPFHANYPRASNDSSDLSDSGLRAEDITRLVMHDAGGLENSHTKGGSGIFGLNIRNDTFHDDDTNEEDDQTLEGVNFDLVVEAEKQFPLDTDVEESPSRPSFDSSYLFPESNSVLPTALSRATERAEFSDTISYEVAATKKGGLWGPDEFTFYPVAGLGLMFCTPSGFRTGTTTDRGGGAYLEGREYTTGIVVEGKMKSEAPIPQLVTNTEVLEAYYHLTPAEWMLREDPKFKKWRVRNPSRLRNSMTLLRNREDIQWNKTGVSQMIREL